LRKEIFKITLNMKLKKLLTYAIAIACTLTISSCHEDNINPDKPNNPNNGEPDTPFVPYDKIEGRNVCAYVTYWGLKIPEPSIMTHLNYAFAELYVVDGEYKGFKLQGNQSRFETIVALKKVNPDLKISLSFSHTVSNSDNKQGGGFSKMASTDEGRKKFAEDCKAFLEKWGIDGIDIDWEFPGLSWSGHACDPSIDTENHVLLMKQLRETLGDKYILSYAGYVKDKVAVTGGWRYIDIAAVDPYVDFVNIMTYDMDAAPNHHSEIKSPKAYIDCERALAAYLNAGVKPSKLVLGVPFYGRRSFSTAPTAINYDRILSLDPNVYKIDNFDEAAGVPYVTLKSNNSFYCGYDNAKSIALKGEWLHRNGMKGIMYWQYDGDDARGTLRKACWQAVMKP
jgi:chitinase